MLSICTQVQDRNFFLQQTLPTWLEYSCDEIVIFDWPEKEKAENVIKQFSDPRIRLIENQEDELYNINIARNIAIKNSSGEMIFLIDADTKILKTYPRKINIDKDVFIQGHFIEKKGGLETPGLSGTGIFWKYQFDEINGFDERMKGWGWDDADFWNRLVGSGNRRIDHPLNSLEHIEHGDELRMKPYINKDKADSYLKNKRLSEISPWSKNYKQTLFRLKKISIS